MPAEFVRGFMSVAVCVCSMASCCSAQTWFASSASLSCESGPLLPPVTSTTIAQQPMFYDAPPPVFYDYGYGYGPGPASPQRSCPPWRPCGPKQSFGSNWLFRQGYAGADFRPACARHDDCLASGQHSRYCCDRQFLSDLDAACCCSSRPWLCRFKARQYYLGVRLFGWMY